MAAPEFSEVTEDDARELVANLRAADAVEWETLAGPVSAEGLMGMVRASRSSFAVRMNGALVGVYGIGAASLLSDAAVIWFLGTDEMKKPGVRRAFVRLAPYKLVEVSGGYRSGRNLVATSNRLAIRWLKSIGAEFGPSVSVRGAEFKPFTVRF